MPDEYFYLGKPEGLEELMQQLRNEELPIEEIVGIIADIMMPSVSVKDCTMEYKAALHALGFSSLANKLVSIRIRLGKTISVGVETNGPQDLNNLPVEERKAMSDALLATLRASDLSAHRDENGVIVFERDDGDEDVVAEFVADLDKTLGPSAPDPLKGRWSRWL